MIKIKKSYLVAGLLLSLVFGIAAGFWYFSLRSQEVKCKDCNLIMISLADVSAEHMKLYGYERLTTPNLDQWAKDAIVFENAFTQTSWTLPVATSLFTSLYPYSHRVMGRFVDNVLDENIQTLPEILRDQGYKTAAFTGGLDYSNIFGHMRGFEDFEAATDSASAISFAGFKPTIDEATRWLNKNSKEKFFLFLHGYDTHCPFDPPENFKGVFSSTQGKNITVDNKLCLRGYKSSEGDSYEAYYYKDGIQGVVLTQDDIDYLEDLYDEEILSVDALVGNFLGNLDKTILDKTIIVIFSDHGEMFAKHGRFGRAGTVRGTLYDDVAHIPLMIKIPKQSGETAGGKKVSGLAQIIDVMPTLLDILDVPQPGVLQGKSLMCLILGKKEAINDYVFAGSEFGIEEGPFIQQIYPVQSIDESVRSKDWKLIHEVQFGQKKEIKEEIYELYNLNDDPDELHNLIEDQPSVAAKLQKILKDWADKAKSYNVQNLSSPQLLPPDFIKAAKEHGYW